MSVKKYAINDISSFGSQFLLYPNTKKNTWNKISNLNCKKCRGYPPYVVYAGARDAASHDIVCYCHLAATYKKSTRTEIPRKYNDGIFQVPKMKTVFVLFSCYKMLLLEYFF